MNCQWTRVVSGWACVNCGTTSSVRQARECPGGSGSEIRRYAFWPRHRSAVLMKGIIVYPWNFYWLPRQVAEGASVPCEESPPDTSQVGTRLKTWFRRFGFKPGNCNCERIAQALNEAGLEFVANHVNEAVDLIHDSAAQIKITAPKAILRRLIRLAVWSERKCLRKSIDSSTVA